MPLPRLLHARLALNPLRSFWLRDTRLELCGYAGHDWSQANYPALTPWPKNNRL